MTEAGVDLGLLERERELFALSALVEAAGRGEGGVAAIEGSAGIGKTRLLVETRSRAGPGMRILSARADQAHVLLELGPRVVGRAVSPRLSRLPAEARALVEAAVILGDRTPLRHVAALAGMDVAHAARSARS